MVQFNLACVLLGPLGISLGCGSEQSDDVPEEACIELIRVCHSIHWKEGSLEFDCHEMAHREDETVCKPRYPECIKACQDAQDRLAAMGGGHGGNGQHAGESGKGHDDQGLGGVSVHSGEGHGGESQGGDSHGGESQGGESQGGESQGGESQGGGDEGAGDCALIAETCGKLESEDEDVVACVSLGSTKDGAACKAGFADCRSTCGKELCGELGKRCHGGEGMAADCHDLGHNEDAGKCFDGALACFATCEK